MKKTARIIFLLIGTVFPILIGALHTFVHFTELTTESMQNKLNMSAKIAGAEQVLYNTWGVMSFMMGISFILFGALNFTLLRQAGRNAYPPLSGIFIVLIYLACVIYVGWTFDAKEQLFGGIFGFVSGLICLGLSLKGEN